MTENFTAKSVDEAKALAAKKFGKNISEIKFEIVDEGKKGGFLGLGARDAVVKATYTPANAPLKKADTFVSAPKSEPEKAETPVVTAPAKEETPVTAAPVNDAPVATTETKAEAPITAESLIAEYIDVKPEKKAENETPVIAPEKKEAAPKAENAADAHEDDEEDYSLDNFTLIEDESLENAKVKLAKDYITSILNAMDVDVTFTVYQNESGAIINLDSNNNGTIIGRRGETLDALQYLCSIIANKGDKDYFRITIDCLGYRAKRKDTLEQLAAKVAKTVLKTGRSQPLEPMNPYERRVIHSAISKIEGVSSRSVGEEPYRKIIISSTNARPNNRRRDGGRRDNNNRRDGAGRGRNDNRRRNNNRNNNNRNRDNNREVNMERRSVDLSTSFEKDYKRPKPEDTMEGGLYGKIEF
ncbi:MAG: KH domain-containing protein [Ruminococcus sp.]|nr:KH domain-containing protein [Ruminococcus sp.]